MTYELPPEGQDVTVVLDDASEVTAYWSEGAWWVGVENDPQDAVLDRTVTGWHWPVE